MNSLTKEQWGALRDRILERASNHCEWCHVFNGARIERGVADGIEVFRVCVESTRTLLCARTGLPLSHRPSRVSLGRRIRVALALAHLDHDRTNLEDANLVALCQKCRTRHQADGLRKNGAAVSISWRAR